ncbi:MAG: glycosyltransferase family 4 protein [Bacteroidetes bacterium]|nr:glycosyltransferase family 4 protein [Bacteroidota bacterium]MCY4233900.1 glycosyltransferase family 4 protein [Bacteroidota bacterium]
MRILIHDFGAYAFPVLLSKALLSRGYSVGHAYCASLITTPCNVGDDVDGLTLLPINTSRPLNKYNLIERWRQEREYGHLAERVVLDFKPDIVFSANTPLNAQQRIQRICKLEGIPFVFWLQDLIGMATSKILKTRLPLIASCIGYYFQQIEAHQLRTSHAVISITQDFTPYLNRCGVATERITVIENWGTLDAFHGEPSQWAKMHQLPERPILLYAGTLSMKHNPSVLLHLSQQLGDNGQVVVVSQGKGADWLKDSISNQPDSNLTVLPYQDPDQLPAMYSAADILLVLLTEDAGEFSVPSKLLTCLCAAKPILAAVPQHNLATRIIEKSGAGLVTDPDNHKEFVTKGLYLLSNPEHCKSMSTNAVQWAEERFNIKHIADQFEAVLRL